MIDSGSASDIALLADFAEAVGGLTLNEYGSLIALKDQPARLRAFRKAAKEAPDTPGTLYHFIRRFLPD